LNILIVGGRLFWPPNGDSADSRCHGPQRGFFRLIQSRGERMERILQWPTLFIEPSKQRGGRAVRLIHFQVYQRDPNRHERGLAFGNLPQAFDDPRA
jgi:hypothetical protein